MSLIGLGIFVMNDIGATGATFQMVNHGLLSVLLFLIAGVVEVRTGDGPLPPHRRRSRAAAPGSRRSCMTTGIATLAVPGSALFASEFLVLLGAFRDWWLIGALASLAIVLAAMYMLRWISALLHDAPAEPSRRALAACATCAGRRPTSCRSWPACSRSRSTRTRSRTACRARCTASSRP